MYCIVLYCTVLYCSVLYCIVFLPYQVVLKVYSWFCAYGSVLIVLEEIYLVPDIKPRLVVCMAITLCAAQVLWLLDGSLKK